MPLIFKSGKEFKGNARSGAKPDSVKRKKWLEEVINNGLANQIANRELMRIEESEKPGMEELKVIVMPVVLKGMSEKVDLTTKGKSLNYAEDQKQKIAERIISRRRQDNGGSGEELSN